MYDTGEQDLGSESLWNCHSRKRCAMILPSFWMETGVEAQPREGQSSAPHSSTELHFTASWAPTQQGVCTSEAENYFSSAI